jgi:hypothetical protein
MTNIKRTIFIAIAFLYTESAFSQNINWENFKAEEKHLVNLNVGCEYGFVFGAGYGYHLRTKLPVLLNIEFSSPAGENLLDDYKTKIGGQVRLYRINNFNLSLNIYGVFRRYENPMARLLNFGSDFSGVVGYYKSKWFVAGEFGFDKAIVTQFKNTDLHREIYPQIQDGWYNPATGGNFYYGIQTGISMKQSEFTLAIGKLATQDFKSTPIIPFYARIGYVIKIKENKK